MKKIMVYFNSMNAAGGIERVIANLINQWSGKYQIILLTKDEKDSFYPLEKCVQRLSLDVPLTLDMNSRVQRVINVTINFTKSLRKLKEYLREIDPDYIYVATPLTALEIFLMGREFQQKLIVSEHSSNFAYNQVYQMVRKVVYPKAYKISVPTKMDTEIYIKKGYNAVYIPHLSTYPIFRCEENKKHTIINVGRLTSDKQQLLLLEIWQMFVNNHPDTDWNLKIIGSGEKNRELHEFIDENKLMNVTIYPATKEIAEFYKEASLFLFTSKMEGFGMVLLEAMAYGVGCISFDCPSGPRDIISDNHNGYLIPCYNKKLFLDAIERITSSPQICKRFSENAYRTIELWDNHKIMDSWDELFGVCKNES